MYCRFNNSITTPVTTITNTTAVCKTPKVNGGGDVAVTLMYNGTQYAAQNLQYSYYGTKQRISNNATTNTAITNNATTQTTRNRVLHLTYCCQNCHSVAKIEKLASGDSRDFIFRPEHFTNLSIQIARPSPLVVIATQSVTLSAVSVSLLKLVVFRLSAPAPGFSRLPLAPELLPSPPLADPSRVGLR